MRQKKKKKYPRTYTCNIIQYTLHIVYTTMTNPKNFLALHFFHFLLLSSYSYPLRDGKGGNNGQRWSLFFFFCTGEAFEITLQKKKKKRYNENNK